MPGVHAAQGEICGLRKPLPVLAASGGVCGFPVPDFTEGSAGTGTENTHRYCTYRIMHGILLLTLKD